MTALENLYYGGAILQEQSVRQNHKEKQLLKLLARHEKELAESFTDAQKETFEKFTEAYAEWYDMKGFEAFQNGFTWGVRLMVESVGVAEEEPIG